VHLKIKKMRIGIEAQRLQRSHKHGMDRVALELIKNLQEIDKENEYFIFVKSDEDTKAISNTSNFTVVEIPGGSYPYWEQYKLPKMVEKYNCDILHCTSNTGPIFSKTPMITTLHDIIFLQENMMKLVTSSASSYQKFGNLYRIFIVANVVKSSRRIITVSNYEKQNINAHFTINGPKITAIHNGVSSQFLLNFDSIHSNKVKTKYNLPDSYVFHIANKDPRKNTKRVLKGFQQFLKSTIGTSYKLVMLGYKEADLKVLLNEIDASEIYEDILLMGYVSDEDLPEFYRLAQVFLFPSLKEGFGIPIIEAMACGVPVITSNISAMPEVAGDAAHIIDPYNVDEISNGILKILSDSQYKTELIVKGKKRYQMFSWKSMAMSVLEEYQQLFNEQ